MGLLNPGGPVAQFKRNRCSISPVELILQSGVCSGAVAGRERCPDAGLRETSPCGGYPVGLQEIHEHEALRGGFRGRLYCRLISFSRVCKCFCAIILTLPAIFCFKSKRPKEIAAPKSRINTEYYNKNTIELELKGSDFNGVFTFLIDVFVPTAGLCVTLC